MALTYNHMHMLYSNPQTENLEKHYADIQAKAW